MRLRPALALVPVAVAAAVAATPAAAFIPPVCSTRLVDAAPGVNASCSTENAPAIANRVTRTITVEVAAGAVDAVLTCGIRSTGTFRVSGPEPVRRSVTEAGNNCVATITAVVDNTSAAVTSTFLYTPVQS
jgi:hypothetical protein